ncbi:hypothetical protein [Mammaliicoccus vitulinus]|uniref:hypothetical protein n=1 Tax=Mammaliicoccus vitulinus TaxID=71237 RepID=UPI00036EF564|nr:hypothetical protein [Mammaliicoccus vitulinus]
MIIACRSICICSLLLFDEAFASAERLFELLALLVASELEVPLSSEELELLELESEEALLLLASELLLSVLSEDLSLLSESALASLLDLLSLSELESLSDLLSPDFEESSDLDESLLAEELSLLLSLSPLPQAAKNRNEDNSNIINFFMLEPLFYLYV